eukprot:653553-Amphidinium_carterae.1
MCIRDRLAGERIRWMKAQLKQADVVIGRINANGFHGNGQADVLANVCNFWRLVGPQLRERPEDEPRTRLPAEPAVTTPENPVSEQALSEARVVRHEAEAFLHCVDCGRQTGKVKRKLKKRKVKVRPTGFAAPFGGASSSGGPPTGEATGCPFPLASSVLPGSTGNASTVAPGRTGSTGEAPPGRTGESAPSQPGQPA